MIVKKKAEELCEDFKEKSPNTKQKNHQNAHEPNRPPFDTPTFKEGGNNINKKQKLEACLGIEHCMNPCLKKDNCPCKIMLNKRNKINKNRLIKSLKEMSLKEMVSLFSKSVMREILSLSILERQYHLSLRS